MRVLVVVLAVLLIVAPTASAAEPLPSWNDGVAKAAIVAFVARVTDASSADFVPAAERIATFDNDGCLWAEQPVYFQLLFAVDRVKAIADKHPEWQTEEPFASVIKGELRAAAAGGKPALMKLLAATHVGMTTDEFSQTASDWIATARHPTIGRRYTEMVYQPMLELLGYLRASGFKTFIVSGGGVDFVRAWSAEVYGIPPEQVVGSSFKLEYGSRDGRPAIVKLPEVDLINDKAGKPVGIQSHIGRRPIFAAGNSDGDFEMLEWTTTGPGARFGLVVHHTDAEREWAYDRQSPVGKLDRALTEAQGRGWRVVDMARDWKAIYPPAAAE